MIYEIFRFTAHSHESETSMHPRHVFEIPNRDAYIVYEASILSESIVSG